MSGERNQIFRTPVMSHGPESKNKGGKKKGGKKRKAVQDITNNSNVNSQTVSISKGQLISE